MIYSKNGTTLLGKLPKDKEVRIKLIYLKDDTLIDLEDDVCIQSKNKKGMYLFNTNKIENFFNGKIEDIEIAYIMYLKDDPNIEYGGKIVISMDYKKLQDRLIFMEEQIDKAKLSQDKLPDDIFEKVLIEDEYIDTFKEIIVDIKDNVNVLLALQ